MAVWRKGLFTQATTETATAEDGGIGDGFSLRDIHPTLGGDTIAAAQTAGPQQSARIAPPAATGETPPVVDLNGEGAGTGTSVNFVENQGAILIAPSATVTDPDSPDFDGGTLTVSFAAGATEDDQLRLRGQFYIDEGAVYYSNPDPNIFDYQIGTATGGNGTSPLVITFNIDATRALVEGLVRSISYSNRSESPADGARTLTFVLTDGDGGTSAPATAQVNVTSVDDPAVARDDALTTPESAVLVGSLFADNGNGADGDPDGIIQVTAVNGQAVVGQTITLASGARLRVNADGTFSYDPNGVYNSLAGQESGAVNTSAMDSFSYTITGGDTADVVVTITGEPGPSDRLQGSDGDDVITGTPFRDVFLLQQGGNDAAFGLGGNDTFYFGGTFTPGDSVDGGGGVDSIILQGDYANGILFGTRFTSNITGIETISLAPGNFTDYGAVGEASYSYSLITLDGAVAPGGLLKVNGFYLRAGESFTFNNAQETDGRFILLAGQGVDNLTGGAGNDIFVFGHDGRFGANDVVAGGGGYDSVYLRGDYTIDFNAMGFTGALSGVESITLGSFSDTQFVSGGDGEFDYALVWNNAFSGVRITVNGSGLTANETMSFDGSSETETAFRLFGGAAADDLRGGSANDSIYGGGGADNLYGFGGNDVFLYYDVSESTSLARDGIQDFRLGDLIDLSSIDANSALPGDQAFSFRADGLFTNQPGQLRVIGAGPIYTVQGDVNGDGVADIEILVVVADSHPLTAVDFVL